MIKLDTQSKRLHSYEIFEVFSKDNDAQRDHIVFISEFTTLCTVLIN